MARREEKGKRALVEREARLQIVAEDKKNTEEKPSLRRDFRPIPAKQNPMRLVVHGLTKTVQIAPLSRRAAAHFASLQAGRADGTVVRSRALAKEEQGSQPKQRFEILHRGVITRPETPVNRAIIPAWLSYS